MNIHLVQLRIVFSFDRYDTCFFRPIVDFIVLRLILALYFLVLRIVIFLRAVPFTFILCFRSGLFCVRKFFLLSLLYLCFFLFLCHVSFPLRLNRGLFLFFLSFFFLDLVFLSLYFVLLLFCYLFFNFGLLFNCYRLSILLCHSLR